MAVINVGINGKKVSKEVPDNTILSDTSLEIFLPLILIFTTAIIIPLTNSNGWLIY